MKAVVISSLVSSLLGLSGANLFAYKNMRAKKDGGHHDHPVNIVEQMLDAAGATPRKESAASTHFYDAAVKDHYTTSIATEKEPKWSQRYYVDTSFWKGEGSPVFLYIGGEGPQSAPSSRLFMWALAEEHGALMLSLEHRYYGESYPVEDMSDENLVFLTSAQALADVARFVTYINSYDPSSADESSSPALDLPASTASSKWVAFGGSYPGNLATWLKLKYPALVEGVVGSSAPVFAQYDYVQYAGVVGDALAYELIGGSSGCASTVGAATKALNDLVTSTTPYGTSDEIPEVLRPCSPMDNDLDLSTYQAELFGNFQGAVQYNDMGSSPRVTDLCAAMAAASEKDGATPLDAFAAATALFYNESAPFADRCIAANFQEDYVAPFLADTNFSGVGCNLTCASSRQWIYQSCNEFGYFQTTVASSDYDAASLPPSQVANPFSSFSALDVTNAGEAVCDAAFQLSEKGLTPYTGPKKNDKGPLANTDYGARHVEGLNITMPNGSMDPWHALSVVNGTDPFYESGSSQETTPGVAIVEIDGTAHCRDMYAPGTFEDVGIPDTTSVQWGHAVIAQNVAKYIGASTSKNKK